MSEMTIQPVLETSVMPSVNNQVDLRFYEDKIRSSTMAIAEGFREIYAKELWKAHSSNYQSFKAYVEGVWANSYSYDYVSELVRAGENRHILEQTVTSRATALDVSVLTSPKQIKQLKTAGTPDQQADVLEKVIKKHGDSPSTEDIKQEVAEAARLTRESFPLGSAVIVTSGKSIPYEGSEGYVMGYEGNGNAMVNLLMDGDIIDGIVIPLRWLTLTGKPPIEIIPPAPKQKAPPNQTAEQIWRARAIALLQMVFDEAMSEHCGEIQEFLGGDS